MIHLLAGAAFATTWWAATPSEADAVRAALDASWPDSGIDVQVGPPGEGDAIWADRGAVFARLGGEEHPQQAPDVSLQVVLVRSWTRDLVVDDVGWIPAPEPPPEPEPEPEAPPVVRPRPIGAISVGTALRAGDGAGLATAAIEGGVRVAQAGGLIRLEGQTFETTDLDTYGYRTDSGAVSFGFVGWPLLAPDLSWSLTVGFRARRHRVTWSDPPVDPIGRWTTMNATTRASARWTKPVRGARVGVALAIELDGPTRLGGARPEEGEFPVLAAAELVVERR